MKTLITMRTRRRRAGRGFTLVELLVAVTLGLMITVVIAQLFINSRETFAVTDDISRMQENIRFTQNILIRTVHLAGYKSQPNSVTGTMFPLGSPPGTGTPALWATDGAGTNSDTLTVRFQGSGDGAGTPDNTVVDCLGVGIDAGVMATSIFSIQASPITGNNALFCNGVELVPDVVNMQIVFGVDTNGDLTVDHYVPLPSVATSNMNNVLTVRIALLYQTPQLGQAAITRTSADATQFVLNDVTLPAFNDRRIRRAVTTTINLRNRTP